MDEEYEIPQVKPRTGFILSIVAAIFIILGAVAVIYLGVNPSVLEGEDMQDTLANLAETMGTTPEATADIMASTYLGMGVFGVVAGLLIILGGALAYYRDMRVAGGVMVLLFSILSLFGAAGLFIGMILGIVGGVLILMNR